ncbi:PREDICTED: ceramide synthase 6-like isoform X2 [Priapulus caudatus]|uniref:Ceramide synthase 6-like isoform X2 n=1 Tax=Priapulus caudatus TaxID=37621 RepID=A0ABM1F8U4_PRICU|nr:PREDICTED: ceramide synthase 6-like isoform X2 [Priapulus caudatus]
MAVFLEAGQNFSAWFWNPGFWLPPNVTWEDIRSTDEVRYVEFSDLLASVPLAVGVLMFRYLFERIVAAPIGQYFNLKDTRPRPAAPNPVLEEAYRHACKPSHRVVTGLAKQLDVTERHIERWFRQRRNQDRPSVLRKFTESCWRFLYYLSAFVYGVCILWNKPWFWDTTHCWINFPFQPLLPEVYWFYMIEMSFYLSLTFSQFLDVKRKDFWQMFVHHMCTLMLLTFSWGGNMIRVGTLVLVIHDAVDFWMEAAKMAKYCRLHRLCDLLFIIFTVMWFLTRLVIFPYRVLRTVMYDAHVIIGEFKSRMLFLALLYLLQILHLIWFYMLCQVACKAIQEGQVQKDGRSDSESDGDVHDSSGEQEATAKLTAKKFNNHEAKHKG